jgi:hypothetical protein
VVVEAGDGGERADAAFGIVPGEGLHGELGAGGGGAEQEPGFMPPAEQGRRIAGGQEGERPAAPSR